MYFPASVKDALRRHVKAAIERLDPNRYAQEPAYVAALLGRLDGVVYEGQFGRVEMLSTVVTDRGPRSAESVWGADFGIVGILRNTNGRVDKAVYSQAKKGSLVDLRNADREQFELQCRKMAQVTRSILGFEVPTRFGQGVIVREIEIAGEIGREPEMYKPGRKLPRSIDSQR
jgi:hypothetical protein